MALPSGPNETRTPIHTGQGGGDTRSTLPTLPTELWLQVLEQVDSHDFPHLWCSVRLVSWRFKGYVERHFMSDHLPDLTISLALPGRDPRTDTLKWPGDPIPRAGIYFTFGSITANRQYAILRSPESLGSTGEMVSVDELRRAGTLPVERLQEAPPWVWFGKSHLTGVEVAVRGRFLWDDDRKMWTWEIDWRKLVTHFHQAKMRKRQSIPARKHRKERW
jgi:hypothetical protein